MDSEDISRLCASLSLIEREGPVRKLGGNLKQAALQRLSVSLVGKILTNKMVNREAFMRVISRLWHVYKGVDIESLTGEMIGDVVEVDGGLAGDCVGKFLRVRVRIDISKPLRRCLRVDILCDKLETIMLLRYERLPNICFKCGRIGHTTNECQSEELNPVVDGVEKLLFGAWMKASGISRRNTIRNYDRYSNSFQKEDKSGRMMLPTSVLDEVHVGQRNFAEKGVIADIPMTDAPKPYGNVDNLKAASISVCPTAFKEINDCERIWCLSYRISLMTELLPLMLLLLLMVCLWRFMIKVGKCR
ncbi:hypothetical protein EZV62_018420 [Acer yangbiense]|uniref:CCHC-type domain-containing protein n=1 Tax=Acer yangbiense TaxID=1000413 RepID=A0A5C7HJB7_9ROSI|nr:hypothetical protein EZV62_018420 [Acer yangbiense]